MLCLYFLILLANKVDSQKSCGLTFNGTEGVISSYSPYSRGEDCFWEITPRVHVSYIKLTWKEFMVDGVLPSCNNDFVEVYSGCESPVKLVRFCSNNMIGDLPHDIYTNQNCLKIRLHASEKNSTRQTGFVASFEVFSTGYANVATQCRSDTDLHRKAGVIASPKWPIGFTGDDLPGRSKECEWDIKAAKLNVIQINVMDIDFDGSSDCYKKNRLKLTGEHSVTNDGQSDGKKNKKKKTVIIEGKNVKKFCTTEKPFTWSTSYYEIEVELKGGYYQPSKRRGFILGYVHYRDDELIAKVILVMQIALIVVGIIIAGCVLCFVKKRWWDRRQTDQVASTNVQENASLTGYADCEMSGAKSEETVALNTQKQYVQYGNSEEIPPPPYPGPQTDGITLPPPILNQPPYPPMQHQPPYPPAQQPPYTPAQQPFY
ncbi:uncharacterized protein [Clytia hemisphaerica]